MPPTTDSDRSFRFEINGTTYTYTQDDVTSALARECRAETGYGPLEVLRLVLTGGADVDTVAALVWLARRQAGEPMFRQEGRRAVRLWDEVTKAIDYTAIASVKIVEDEVPADPET